MTETASVCESLNSSPVKDAPKRTKKTVDLYVRGFPSDVTEDDIKSLFSKQGEVTRVTLLPVKNPSWPRAGFVNFAKQEDAQNALDKLNQHQYNEDSKLTVSFATGKGDKKKSTDGKFSSKSRDHKRSSTESYHNKNRNRRSSELKSGVSGVVVNTDSGRMKSAELNETSLFDGSSKAKNTWNKSRFDKPNNSLPCSFVSVNEVVEAVVVKFNLKSQNFIGRFNTKEYSSKISDMEKNYSVMYSDTEKYFLKYVNVGDLCMSLSFHQGKPSWRRAVIESKVKENVFNVFYFDYGVVEKCPLSRLCKMDNKLKKEPCLGFKCTLSLFSGQSSIEWNDDVSAFVQDWLKSNNNEVKIKVVSGNSFHLVVDMLANDGFSLEKVLKLKFGKAEQQSSSVDAFKYEYSKMPAEDFECVLSHVIDPSHLFMQEIGLTFMKHWEQTTKLQKSYSSENLEKIPKLETLSVGTACVARSPVDDKMMRAEVVAATGEQAKVRFVDCGNEATLSASSLYKLHPNFHQLPAQAFRVALSGCHEPAGGWSKEAVDYMNGLVTNKFMATRTDRNLSVELLDEDDNLLNEIMLSRNWAVKTPSCKKQTSKDIPSTEKPESPVKHAEKEEILPFVPTTKSKVCSLTSTKAENVKPAGSLAEVQLPSGDLSVCICHVENPSEIYVQLIAPDLQRLSEQQDQMSAEFDEMIKNKVVELASPLQVGSVCATKFSEDEQWYRAVIVAIQEDVRIQFVDYGNYDQVASNKLYDLPDKYQALPRQAIRSSLAKCYSEEWSLQANAVVERFQSMPLMAKVVNTKNTDVGRVLEIDVEVEGDCTLSELLVKNGLATDSKLEPDAVVSVKEDLDMSNSLANDAVTFHTVKNQQLPEGEFKVLITHVENPHSVFCQVVTKELMYLDTQQKEIASKFQDRKQLQMKSFEQDISQVSPGVYCVALFKGDLMWYRAKVLKSSQTRKVAKVLFVDYGNTEVVPFSDIYALPEEFSQYPAQAVEAKIFGCGPISSQWSPKATEIVSEYKDSLLQAVKEKDGSVKITVEGSKHIGQLLVGSGEARLEPISRDVDDMSRTFSDFSLNRGADCETTVLSSRRSSDSSVKAQRKPMTNKAVKTKPVEPVKFEKAQVDLNAKVRVRVSRANGKLVCHLVEQEGEMADMIEEINAELKAGREELDDFQLMSGCAALHLKSNKWQRAVILKEMEQQLRVCFVDLGTFDCVDKTNVCWIPRKFCELPPFAVSCQIADVRPLIGCEESFEEIVQGFGEKVMEGVFVGKVPNKSIYKVKLPLVANKVIASKIGEYFIDV